METELKKVTVSTGEMLPPGSSAVLAEGDVIVPDVKPDAKQIMSADADGAIKKCEISGNLLKVSGSIFVNVLYLPEGDGASPDAINTRFDFTENLPLASGENLNSTATCSIRHIDFSLTNSRKLNLKVYAEISARSHKDSSFEYADNPEGSSLLEVKKEHCELLSVIGDKKNEIIVSENIEIPQSKSDIGKILKVNLKPRITETKALNDKILVKGSVLANILYITGDSEEEAECVNAEIPFSDVFEFDGLDEDSHVKVNAYIKDYYYNIKNDINDNPRVLSLEALLDVNIFAYTICSCNPVVDCFIPGHSSEITLKEVCTNKLLYDEKTSHNIREKLLCSEKNISEVMLSSLKPIITEEALSNGSITIKGLLAGSVALKTDDDALVFVPVEIPFEHTQNISDLNEKSNIYCNVSVSSENYNISGGEAELFATVCVDLFALSPVCFSVASDCTFSENEEKSVFPMLVIYFVQSDDTMWDIAKRYKTTPDKIKCANNMTETDKICAGMKLLIPSV